MAADPAAPEAVRTEWRHRCEAEYRSAALTQHLTLWLIQLALSPDLISDGLRITADELEHARLSHDVYLAAGGQEPPTLDRPTLALTDEPDRALEDQALLATVKIFCLGETVAVPLFRHLRAGCDQPQARGALDRIMSDEGRHAAFGWQVLDAFGERLGTESVRRTVEPVLPAMFGELDLAYGRGAAARDDGVIGPADRRWGVVPAAEYLPILESTVEGTWIPRFAAAGIDARAAWHLARQPG